MIRVSLVAAFLSPCPYGFYLSLSSGKIRLARAPSKRVRVVVSVIFFSFRRPQSRRDYPLNLSILLSGGKETNQDFLSSGERTGKSPAPNPAVPPQGNVVFGRVRLSRRRRVASKSILNGATYPQRVPGP